MKKNIIFYIGMAVLLLCITWSSCRKKEKQYDPTRQFMPSGDVVARSGETAATLTWKEAINADTGKTTYTVIVSTDSLFTSAPEFTFITDTAGIVISDTQIAIKTIYYARIKTNGSDPSLDSKWLTSPSFQITGEQIFLPVSDIDLKHNAITLRWKPTSDVIKIELTGAGNQTINLTQENIDSAYVLIENLTPEASYAATISSAVKEKGYVEFTTKPVPLYAFILNPGDDLVTVLDTCSPNIIIGLNPGEYQTANLTNNLVLKNKTVTVVSVSNNPADTKVHFKEVVLKGDGAGISLKGITFDASLTSGLYFINLTGLNSDGEDATFSNVIVENCVVTNFGNCFMRANRSTNNAGHKIGDIVVTNCIVKENLLTNFYTEFQLTKLQFNNLLVTNSTFFNVGQNIIEATTTLPSGSPVPNILFDKNTFNNLGANAKRLFDANANPVTLTITNNILGNSPRSGTMSGEFIRASGSGTAVNLSYNNWFKLTSNGTNPLTIPSSTAALTSQTANQQIDLGWNSTTTNFTVPANSPLQTASSTGGLIGDPRWQ